MKINIAQVELAIKGQIEVDIEQEYVYGVESAGKIFSKEIGKSNIEMTSILCMDHTNKVINYSTVAMGNSENVTVPISQILRIALLSNASKIIVAHNHPSGILKINNKDIELTKKIGRLAKMFNIVLIDSIIVNSTGEIVSIREKLGGQKYELSNI